MMPYIKNAGLSQRSVLLLRFMRVWIAFAISANTFAVQVQTVVCQLHVVALSNLFLSFFDDVIRKFDHFATI